MEGQERPKSALLMIIFNKDFFWLPMFSFQLPHLLFLSAFGHNQRYLVRG